MPPICDHCKGEVGDSVFSDAETKKPVCLDCFDRRVQEVTGCDVNSATFNLGEYRKLLDQGVHPKMAKRIIQVKRKRWGPNRNLN